MPLLASIDIGSNTVRLLIGNIERRTLERVRHEMAITRLAEGISSDGMMKKETIERSVSVLRGFSSLISAYKASHIKAVGTSALREADNSSEFTKRVFSETGISVEIISGIDEAALTAQGVLFDLPAQNAFILDIGGGSTEWILCNQQKISELGTIPAGVVKLHEAHIASDPPSEHDIKSLRNAVSGFLLSLKQKINARVSEHTEFIGTAGTITTLAAIDLNLQKYDREKVHKHTITLDRLRELADMLIPLPVSERKKISGLEPERADLIIPGIVFTISVMEIFGFSHMTVSDNGLLEGALIKLSQEISA